MKRIFITLLFSFIMIGATAQNANNTTERNDTVNRKVAIGVNPEQMPEYPGGNDALLSFLKKNIRYPQLAQQYGVEGKVIMTFLVDEKGALKDISAHDCKIERFNTTKFYSETEAKQKELKKEFALLFAKEGARVIRKMPKWKPGKLNDKAIKVRYNLPIRFSIPDK